MRNTLNIGVKSQSGQVEIIAEDSLCYLVKNFSRGSYGLRTISKAIIEEYVNYFEKNPKSNADQARSYLVGKSEIDKYEYGYSSTLMIIAKMILGLEPMTTSLYRSEDSIEESKVLKIKEPHQIIYYGAPGTGKSHKIKKYFVDNSVSKDNIFRTTFHPDSDYSTFVGAYKPSKDTKKMYGLNGGSTVRMEWKGEHLEEEVITYNYIPQTFLLAYMQAYKKPNENVFLVIEEINRGNCAQIFGDLFQLLDRDESGKSEYSIKADTDLKRFLEAELGEDNLGIAGGELKLPSNLYIWATMNTSDQSLFPIDSAFKRRWDWEYVPIQYCNTDWLIDIDGILYSWVDFQREINKRILKDTGSEDKMMGDYFEHPSDGVITKKAFLNKILFYLWNDVCKDGDTDIFPSDGEFSFSILYGDDSNETIHVIMEKLGIKPVEVDEYENGDCSEGENSNATKEPSKRPVFKYTINGSSKHYSTPDTIYKVIEDYAQENPETSVEEMIELWNRISNRKDCLVEDWEPSPNDNSPAAGRRRVEIKWGIDKSVWMHRGWTAESFIPFINNVNEELGIIIAKVE